MAKLEFRYGAMNSGKSMMLLQVAYNYTENNRSVLLLKSEIDTKGNDFLVSRIGPKRQVDIVVKKDEPILQKKFAKKSNKKYIIKETKQQQMVIYDIQRRIFRKLGEVGRTHNRSHRRKN